MWQMFPLDDVIMIKKLLPIIDNAVHNVSILVVRKLIFELFMLMERINEYHLLISDCISTWTWRAKYSTACFRSLAQSKLRLCSANHKPGYWCNLPCDWPSTGWAYSEQETENGHRCNAAAARRVIVILNGNKTKLCQRPLYWGHNYKCWYYSACCYNKANFLLSLLWYL